MNYDNCKRIIRDLIKLSNTDQYFTELLSYTYITDDDLTVIYEIQNNRKHILNYENNDYTIYDNIIEDVSIAIDKGIDVVYVKLIKKFIIQYTKFNLGIDNMKYKLYYLTNKELMESAFIFLMIHDGDKIDKMLAIFDDLNKFYKDSDKIENIFDRVL